MSELSRRTDLLIQRVVAPHRVHAVRERIATGCGTAALGFEGSTPEQMERLHFAVIRLGAADDAALDRAIRLGPWVPASREATRAACAALVPHNDGADASSFGTLRLPVGSLGAG